MSAWRIGKDLVASQTTIENEACAAGIPQPINPPDARALREGYVALWGPLDDTEAPGRFFLGAKIQQITENLPVLEKLEEVASIDDGDDEAFVPVYTDFGALKTRRGSVVKVPRPRDSDELRRRHRIICNGWLMGSLRHVKREWLDGLTKESWSRFTDYIVGPNVKGFNTGNGTPNWDDVVMVYEEACRKKAYKLIAEGMMMDAALMAAIKDLETRQFYFTEKLLVSRKRGAPADLAAGIANAFKDTKPKASNTAAKTSKKAKKKRNDERKTGGSPGGSGGGGSGSNGNAKGKGKRHLRTPPPESRQICFQNANGKNCDGTCGRAHVCQYCFSTEHTNSHHE